MRDARVMQHLIDECGDGIVSLFKGARQAVTMRRSRVEHLDNLRANVDAELLFVPHQFGALHGLRTLTQLAQALSEEMGL